MKDGIITGVFAPETFWMKTLDLYDGEIEVSPVVVLNGRNEPDFGVYNREDAESYMEVTSMDPPHLWSAYLHQKEGFVDCIGDFTRYQDALEFAEAASAAVKRGKVLKVDSIVVEPQVDRNRPSDNTPDYLDVIGYERAVDGETPDIWAVFMQYDNLMLNFDWELLDDFATEQEARDYAAAVIKRGWC